MCVCVFSVTDSAVMSFLSVGGRERWKGRGSVGVVVLVDDHSTMEGLGQTLLALKDSLALVSGQTKQNFLSKRKILKV